LRLAETAGQACTVTVKLPRFKIVKASGTNLVEQNEAELPHEEHTLRVKMEAHEIATLRLRGAKRWSGVDRFLHF
jgi:hypothetical protein